LKEEMQHIGRGISQKVDESVGRVEDELSIVQRRMSRTMDESAIRDISGARDKDAEIQSMQVNLGNLQQEQHELNARLEETIYRVDANAGRQQRVEEIHTEILSALGKLEDGSNRLDEQKREMAYIK